MQKEKERETERDTERERERDQIKMVQNTSLKGGDYDTTASSETKHLAG